MNAENIQMAYQLMSDFECYSCDEPLDPNHFELERAADSMFKSTYQCPVCDEEYDVEIKDKGSSVSAEIDRKSLPDYDGERPLGYKSTRKNVLRAENHSARPLVRNWNELVDAYSIMKSSQKKIAEKCDVMDKPNGLNTTPDFQAEKEYDIHNFFSSVYTFSQVLESVLSDLPSDGDVAEAKQKYDQQKRVVMGLRIFQQHNRTLPVSDCSYTHPESGEYIVGMTVDVCDVNTIESNTDQDQDSDGYKKGASHHYGDVDGDMIDINIEARKHCETVEELLVAMNERLEEVHGDEIKEYEKLTDPNNYIGE